MKFARKALITLALLGMVGVGHSMTTEACSLSSGCYSDLYSVQCKEQGAPMVTATHIVTEGNGYKVTCTVRSLISSHTIKCDGCGAVLQSGVKRTCSEIHTYEHCIDKYGLCQY